jgi:hypothetical protein
MRKTKQSARTIETHRSWAEQCLILLLQRANSSVTLDIVKRTIFKAQATDFPLFVHAILSALNHSDIDDLDEISLAVIENAWNYFPRRHLPQNQ